MAESSSPRQGCSDRDDDSSQVDYHNVEQLTRSLAAIHLQAEKLGLIGGVIPAEPLARFQYLDSGARLYTARFLMDGSCLEEALSYSDQARAQIPSQVEDSLFRKPDDEGFGDRYVILRWYAWYEDSTPQNARRLVDAIEWKFDVAPESRTIQDIGALVLSKAAIYEQTKNAKDLAGAIRTGHDFLGALGNFPQSASDPKNLDEQRGLFPSALSPSVLFPSVLSCISQLLYHEFRTSGTYGLLELSMKIGNDVLLKISNHERPHLVRSLRLAFIAYSFYYKISDIPRSQQHPLNWGFLDENDESSAVAETAVLPAEPANALYHEFPLASDNSQIRLLQLKPGVGDDPVTCLLEVVDLEHCPEYDALSYVWGDRGVTDSIILHGKQYDITVNLHDALKRLRKSETHRRLWIDALCINQGDIKEKESQIGLMNKIYPKAKEVCMWLGEPTRLGVFSDGTRDIPCHVAAAEMLEKVFPSFYSQIRPHLSILEGYEFELISSANAVELTPILYRLPFSMRPIPSVPDDSILSGSALVQEDRHFSPRIAHGVRAMTNVNLCMDLGEVFKRNTWHQETTKETPSYLNWGNDGQTPWYLESKLSGVDWPICGAFLLINLLAMDIHFHDMPFFGTEGFSCMNGATAQAWNKSCYALYQILTSKYWCRAWILQEIVLAQSARLYFGKHILPYPRLIRAMYNFDRHYLTCCKDVVSDGQTSACGASNWWMRLHDAFTFYIETTFELWALRKDKESRGEDASLPVEDVIFSNFKKREATEPRDLVFSMCGLIKNDGPDAIRVDYSTPVEEAFARATARALAESTHYDLVMSFASQGRSNELKYKVPSWCIDMTMALNSAGSFPEMVHRVVARPDGSGEAQMENDLCLSVTSTKVDIVTQVSSAAQCCEHSDWDDTIHNIQEWRQCASLRNDPRKITLTDTEASFWTTILGGILPLSTSTLPASPSSSKRISNSDLPLILQWQAWLHDPSRRPDPDSSIYRPGHQGGVDLEWFSRAEEFSRFNRRLHVSMMNKRFFVTEKGTFGAGPGTHNLELATRVEEGDEVHLVGRCRVPVVLRLIGKVTGGETKYGHDPAAFSADLKTCSHDRELVYQLVGPCYLDGSMDAEATKEEGSCSRRIFLR